MPRKAPAPPVPPAQPGTMTRTVAPFAPLAIALLASHVATSPAAPASDGATATHVTATSTLPPGTVAPLLKTGQPVDWWFVFKFNSGAFSGCADSVPRACLFGGTVQQYKQFGQQFAYASSLDQSLQMGGGCLGDTATDPVGATFDQVYNGHLFYALWNDQFDGDPMNTEAAPAISIKSGAISRIVCAWATRPKMLGVDRDASRRAAQRPRR